MFVGSVAECLGKCVGVIAIEGRSLLVEEDGMSSHSLDRHTSTSPVAPVDTTRADLLCVGRARRRPLHAVDGYDAGVRDPRHVFDLNVDEPPPPLDPSEVARLEALLAVRLPSALVALLRVRNGGYLRRSRFRYRAGDVEDVVSVSSLTGIGIGGGVDDLFRVPYLRGEWEVPEWAVMLSGDGHTWVALDYRGSAEPSVVYLEESRRDDGFTVTELAPSFDVFLEGLELDEVQTCWGSPEPTGIVLDAIRTRHGLRLSDRFEAAVFKELAETTGRVRLRSNRGHRDELVWPEFPAIRSILECDIDAEQRTDTARWIGALGLPFELIHDAGSGGPIATSENR